MSEKTTCPDGPSRFIARDPHLRPLTIYLAV